MPIWGCYVANTSNGFIIKEKINTFCSTQKSYITETDVDIYIKKKHKTN